MSETQSNSNRTVMYLLGVIILLLVVMLVIVFARQQPASTATNPQATAESTSTAMPGVAPSSGTFDKATATKVPAGQDPQVFVKAYYQNILDKKWAAAFKMQPALSQQGGTVDQFAQTQQFYGMKAFKILSQKVTGDQAVVLVQQDLGDNGTWGATWTFVKDGNVWLVKERQVQSGVAQ